MAATLLHEDGSPAEGGVHDLAGRVAAALREIDGMRAERAAPPIRSARLTLAAIYGATRLRRRLEHEAGRREADRRVPVPA